MATCAEGLEDDVEFVEDGKSCLDFDLVGLHGGIDDTCQSEESLHGDVR